MLRGVSHFLPLLQNVQYGVACAIAAWLLTMLPMMHTVEDWFFDGCLQWRGTRPSDTKVVIVALDDATLRELDKPQPFLSPELAQAVRFAREHGARAVGIDLLVPDYLRDLPGIRPDEPGPIDGNPQPLRNEIEITGRVVLIERVVGGRAVMPLPAWYFRPPQGDASEGMAVSPSPTMGGPGEKPPAAPIRLPTDLACVELTEDSDYFVRRQDLIYRPEEKGRGLVLRPHFALALAAVSRGQELRYTGNRLAIGDEFIPTTDGAIRINFRGPPGSVPIIPLRDVVQGRTTDDEQALIKDAVVIIGVTAKLFGDHHLTPYANRLFSGWTAREPVLMSGAELHAGIVATLLDGAYFWRLPLGWELVLLSGGGVALMGLYLHLGFFRGAVVAIALHFAWKAVCVAALELSNLHLPLSGMLLLSVSCYGAAFHRRYRWMRRMFGVAQSREIAQALVTEPGVLSLRGQERVLSIMFADIRGFSDFSRQKPPHQVTRLLNTYFSAIVPVIERHGGTINQYVGDGIMVLWGAPRPLPDHARCAVEAAVEMGRVVRDMRQTWQDIGIDMAIGVGIHTGRVVVGAVGSPSRLNYTAIGDAVNAAARIESENKTLRTQVLISVATWQELSTADRARLRCEPEPHAVDLKGVGCMEVYAVAVV